MNTISFNNISAKLTGPRLEEIYSKLTLSAPGAIYTPQYKLWKKTGGRLGWDGLVSLLSKNGEFLTGLIPQVVELLDNDVELQDNRPAINVSINDSVSVNLLGYQRQAIDDAISNTYGGVWWPRGVLQLATGGGKTECSIAMCQLISVPTMFIVHRTNLLYQAQERFKKYGIISGVIGNGVFNLAPLGINVATIATINAILKNKDDKRYAPLMDAVDKTQQVFFDEAHLIASKLNTGNLFTRVSSLFKNAPFRWGLTATPFMKDGYSDLLLMGCTGSVLSMVKSSYLVEQGYLAKPTVKIYNISSPMGIPKKWRACYDDGIVHNSFRNEKIIELLTGLPKPAMVLTCFVEHAKKLLTLAEKAGLRVMLATHQTSPEERADMLKSLVSGEYDALIVSTIFDEGIDCIEIASIVMAGGMKSKIKTIQRVGRGMRLAPGKTELTVIDFYDTTARHLLKHSKARIETYENEGFNIEYEKIN